MVRDFQSVIGREAKEQVLANYGRLPDYLVACVGGGSMPWAFPPVLCRSGGKIYWGGGSRRRGSKPAITRPRSSPGGRGASRRRSLLLRIATDRYSPRIASPRAGLSASARSIAIPGDRRGVPWRSPTRGAGAFNCSRRRGHHPSLNRPTRLPRFEPGEGICLRRSLLSLISRAGGQRT